MTPLVRHTGRAALILTFVIFIASLQLNPGYSMNPIYTLPVLLTILSKNPRSTYVVAGTAAALLILHLFIQQPPVPMPALVFTRSVVILNCFLTAYVVQRYRRNEDARKKAEAEVRDQAALAQLGKMAAVVAHEVRNPLAGIRGAMQMVGKRLVPGSAEHRIAGEVVTRVDALNGIVQDLLIFARAPQPALSPIQVSVLLDETVMLLRQDPAIAAVQIAVEPTTAVVSADPGQLKLVLLNLLMNGAQAMGGQGRLDVSAGTNNGWHEIRVRDHGPGIAANVREHLFEPFFTTRPTGTGLGLVTAQRIIEAHGGRVDLESAPDGGALAVVRIPNRRHALA